MGLFLALGVILFVVLIWRTGFDEIIGTLRNFSFLHFCIIFGITALYYMLYAVRWWIIIRSLTKKKVNFISLFFHRLSDYAISYLTPSASTGGAPMRVLLLEHDKISTKTATSSVVIDKGLEVASLFVFQAVAIFIAIISDTLPPQIKWLALIILGIFIVILFWFYYASVRKKGVFSSVINALRLHRLSTIKKWMSKILEIEHQMAEFYKNHWKIFISLIPISVVITTSYLIEHWLIAHYMGVDLTFTQLFLVSTLPYISYMIPVPGGIGLFEGGHAAMFAALGIEINALVFVFIIRIRDLGFILLGLLHASRQGVQMVQSAFTKKKKLKKPQDLL